MFFWKVRQKVEQGQDAAGPETDHNTTHLHLTVQWLQHVLLHRLHLNWHWLVNCALKKKKTWENVWHYATSTKMIIKNRLCETSCRFRVQGESRVEPDTHHQEIEDKCEPTIYVMTHPRNRRKRLEKRPGVSSTGEFSKRAPENPARSWTRVNVLLPGGAKSLNAQYVISADIRVSIIENKRHTVSSVRWWHFFAKHQSLPKPLYVTEVEKVYSFIITFCSIHRLSSSLSVH